MFQMLHSQFNNQDKMKIYIQLQQKIIFTMHQFHK